MKFIYAIICHEVTNPLLYTVKTLSACESNLIIIHVDKKSNIEDFYFLKSVNVLLFEERIDIVWGTFSQIEVTHKLLKFSQHFDFDYFFLLSGNDIPLTGQKEFHKFISINAGCEFFEFQGDRDNYVNPLDRVRFRYPCWYFKRNKNFADKVLSKLYKYSRFLFYRNNSFNIHSKKFPQLYKGSNWFGISNKAVQYTIDFIDGNPWYYKAFIHSYCCDEVFFHSIIKTWPEVIFFDSDEVKSSSLKYTDWTSGPDFPRVLTIDDADKVINSGCFFARKISNSITDDNIQLFQKENTDIGGKNDFTKQHLQKN
ncbi:beta-1,6-N-acetylglucosaminyltransferase [Tatumella sp. UBA2305]|uniref:beta-1,6-N-acetylglucosaminyltransferase n=1 Tax=Tatumella sp. UBA2305 TaxID=1947647 RepID=UPI0025EAC2D2|nr:beta-1,6-N-acetylglucosaminyltransferase [Tatumella sp. UBA2305]